MERGKHWIATRWFKKSGEGRKTFGQKRNTYTHFSRLPRFKKINKLYSFVAGSKILCCLLKNKQHYSKYRFSHNKNSVVKCSSYKLYSILETVSKNILVAKKIFVFKNMLQIWKNPPRT